MSADGGVDLEHSESGATVLRQAVLSTKNLSKRSDKSKRLSTSLDIFYAHADKLWGQSQEAWTSRTLAVLRLKVCREALDRALDNLAFEQNVFDQVKLEDTVAGQASDVANFCAVVFSCVSAPFVNVSGVCLSAGAILNLYNEVASKGPLQLAKLAVKRATEKLTISETVLEQAKRSAPGVDVAAEAAEADCAKVYADHLLELACCLNPPAHGSAKSARTAWAAKIVELAQAQSGLVEPLSLVPASWAADEVRKSWVQKQALTAQRAECVKQLLEMESYNRQFLPAHHLEEDVTDDEKLKELKAQYAMKHSAAQSVRNIVIDAKTKLAVASLSKTQAVAVLATLHEELDMLERGQRFGLTEAELSESFDKMERQHMLIKLADLSLHNISELCEELSESVRINAPVADELEEATLTLYRQFYNKRAAVLRKQARLVSRANEEQSVLNDVFVQANAPNAVARQPLPLPTPAMPALTEEMSITELRHLMHETVAMESPAAAEVETVQVTALEDLLEAPTTQQQLALASVASLTPSQASSQWDIVVESATLEGRRTASALRMSQVEKERSEPSAPSTSALTQSIEAQTRESMNATLSTAWLAICREIDCGLATQDKATFCADPELAGRLWVDAIKQTHEIIDMCDCIIDACKNAIRESGSASRRLRASWLRMLTSAEKHRERWQERSAMFRGHRTLNGSLIKAALVERSAGASFKRASSVKPNEHSTTDDWDVAILHAGEAEAAYEEAEHASKLLLESSTGRTREMWQNTLTEQQCLRAMWGAKCHWLRACKQQCIADVAMLKASQATPRKAIALWDIAMNEGAETELAWERISFDFGSKLASTLPTLIPWFRNAIEDADNFKLLWNSKCLFMQSSRMCAEADLDELRAEKGKKMKRDETAKTAGPTQQSGGFFSRLLSRQNVATPAQSTKDVGRDYGEVGNNSDSDDSALGDGSDWTMQSHDNAQLNSQSEILLKKAMQSRVAASSSLEQTMVTYQSGLEKAPNRSKALWTDDMEMVEKSLQESKGKESSFQTVTKKW